MWYKYLIVAAFLYNPHWVKAQFYTTAEAQKVLILDEQLSQNHVDYKNQRSLISDRISTVFSNIVDPDLEYFTESDILNLKHNIVVRQPVSIKNTINSLDSSYAIVKSQLLFIKMKLSDIRELNFFDNDSIHLVIAPDSSKTPASNTELLSNWKRKLKLRALYRSQMDSSLVNLNDTSEINKVLNVKLRLIIDSEQCRIDSKLKNLHNSILNSFLKAYAQSFDPHSTFFSSIDNDLFRSSLSDKINSTGLVVERNNDKFLVTEIVPLSNASHFEKIKPGDEIISLRINEVFVSLQCLTYTEIEAEFYGKTTNVLELEIKSKIDNYIRTFIIEKSNIDNLLNHTYAFILENEILKVGYILFPSFYTSIFNGGKSSGQDLALILFELQKANIDGLIIDFRENGGGSVQEAVDLAGFFVDFGPLFITTDRMNPSGFLNKDTKRGKLFDGKVVYLTSSFTASAAELVVSSVQPYANQLIIGSTTYGKATGQGMFPLKYPNQTEPFGIANITTFRSYNINGKSFQGVGVIPDIELNTFPSKRLVGEKKQLYMMVVDTLTKSFQAKQKNSYLLNDFIASVNAKYAKDEEEIEFKIKRDSIETILISGFYQSLNYPNFASMDSSIDTSEVPNYDYNILSLEDDLTFMKQNNQLILELESDRMLNEVFKIFQDWLNYK